MAPTNALRDSAAATAPVSGPAARGGAPISAGDQLHKLGRRLRDLTVRVSAGATSHQQHDRNVDEAEAIAAELRAVFRGSSAPVHPPLWQDGGGRAAW